MGGTVLVLLSHLLLASLAAGSDLDADSVEQLERSRTVRGLLTPQELESESTFLINDNQQVDDSGNFLLNDDVQITFQSPGYYSQYQGFLWTAWTFGTWKSNRAMILNCQDFALGPNDYLQISHDKGCKRFYGRRRPSNKRFNLPSSSKLQVELRTSRYGIGRMRCTVEVPAPFGGSSGGSSGGLSGGSSGGSSSGSSGGSSSGSSGGFGGSGFQSAAVRINDPICGKSKYQLRIVGGMPAPKYAYPWVLGMATKNGNSPFCSASIINEKYAVTAAHCVKGQNTNEIVVLARKHVRDYDSEQLRIGIRNIKIHPSYNDKNSDNDIALLELADSLRDLLRDSDGKVRPVCLPTRPCTSCFANRAAILNGWGLLKFASSGQSAQVPVELQHVTVPFVTNDKCDRAYSGGGSGRITDNMICAGLDEGGKDTCQGDSGGGLLVKDNRFKYTLQGIVSFGNECAKPGFPGVYTRVAKYYHWIQRNARV